MKKSINLVMALVMLFCLASCAVVDNNNIVITDTNWYPINESYLDPAIQVRFEVKNIGNETVMQYAVKMDLYDDNGRYLTSFTSTSNHSLASGETENGNIHLEPQGINVNDVEDIKFTIIDEVV